MIIGDFAMAVTYRCPNIKCRKVLNVPSNLRGKNVRCSYCATTHSVPISKVPQRQMVKKKQAENE